MLDLKFINQNAAGLNDKNECYSIDEHRVGFLSPIGVVYQDIQMLLEPDGHVRIANVDEGWILERLA